MAEKHFSRVRKQFLAKTMRYTLQPPRIAWTAATACSVFRYVGNKSAREIPNRTNCQDPVVVGIPGIYAPRIVAKKYAITRTRVSACKIDHDTEMSEIVLKYRSDYETI